MLCLFQPSTDQFVTVDSFTDYLPQGCCNLFIMTSQCCFDVCLMSDSCRMQLVLPIASVTMSLCTLSKSTPLYTQAAKKLWNVKQITCSTRLIVLLAFQQAIIGTGFVPARLPNLLPPFFMGNMVAASNEAVSLPFLFFDIVLFHFVHVTAIVFV